MKVHTQGKETKKETKLTLKFGTRKRGEAFERKKKNKLKRPISPKGNILKCWGRDPLPIKTKKKGRSGNRVKEKKEGDKTFPDCQSECGRVETGEKGGWVRRKEGLECGFAEPGDPS